MAAEENKEKKRKDSEANLQRNHNAKAVFVR